MGSLRFSELQTRPTEVLDLISLPVDELQRLSPPFEAAFQAYIAEWRLDRQPRTALGYTTDKNCPLPTSEDRLLCLLVYLKTYPLQVVQGRLFGTGPTSQGSRGGRGGHASPDVTTASTPPATAATPAPAFPFWA